MKELSYNLSLALKEHLKRIEILRTEILLTPLSQKIELQLRREAVVLRIFSSLKLIGKSLTKNQVQKMLAFPPRKPSMEEKEIIKYKKALDYIQQNWLVCKENVTSQDLLALHDLAHSGQFRIPEGNIKRFLEYLQVNPENPVVQAAIAQAHIVATSPFAHNNGSTARLLAYLMLYKSGYDFRGLLVLEETWEREPEFFRNNLQAAIEKGNLTLWIEFFAQSVISSLEKALTLVTTDGSRPINRLLPQSFWDLDERQKAILAYLENPGTSITNRKVQQMFKVSQITASRNLAKLLNLGLLFSHDKGRSIYYTKI